MESKFEKISILKKTNVYYRGLSLSRTITLKDGSKKTLGVILPNNSPLIFETHLDECIEIVSGKCFVKIGDDIEYKLYVEGESFKIPKNKFFKIKTDEVVDYICHFL